MSFFVWKAMIPLRPWRYLDLKHEIIKIKDGWKRSWTPYHSNIVDGTLMVPAIWSRGFPDLFGMNSIQSIRDIQTTILPSDAAALEGMIFALQKDNEPFSLSVRVSNSQKTITLHGMKGQDLDGVEQYDVLWAEDTTLERNALDDKDDILQELEKNITRYRSIFDHLPQAIWVTNEKQQVQCCNKVYEDLVGKERKEILDQSDGFQPILSDAYKVSVQEMSKSALDSGDSDSSTGRVILNGKRHLMDIYVSPNQDNEFVAHSAHDITEQEDLRAQLKRYVTANAELLEQLTTAIAIFGADHGLEFYNQAFSGLWGVRRPMAQCSTNPWRYTRKAA